MKTAEITKAQIGSISAGTLRTKDLLEAFVRELEWHAGRNGAFLSLPENCPLRDRLAGLIGDAQDCFTSDGASIRDDKKLEADELVNETLPDALLEFAPAHCYFGSHPGADTDFGFWAEKIASIQERVAFSSCEGEKRPPDDFRGEWLCLNGRWNRTLYIRGEDGKDTEIWSLV